MAGKVPFFLTGVNAKLKVNGVTLAFCADLTYSVSVKHAAPKVLGMYEAYTLEPLMYEVTGSFTLIRYIKGYNDYLSKLGHQSADLTDNHGNGIGSWGPQSGTGKLLAEIGLPFSAEGRAYESLNPSKLQNSAMFDIELYQLGPDGNDGMFARFRDCRVSRADTHITKKGATTQTFAFQACYLDEDTFNAVFSGSGQQL